MSNRLAVLVLILAGLGSRLFAAGPQDVPPTNAADQTRIWHWTTTLDTTVGVGDTRYLMEEPASGVSSELIFPLDTLLAGITFHGQRTGDRLEGRRDWGLELSLAVNLVAPFGLMQDYDWWMYPGYPKVAFSYTESSARMLWLNASLAWKPVLVSGAWGSLDAVLGYRFQYISQKIDGYKGWQYKDTDLDGQPELYLISDTGIVLTYWVMWNTPTAGLSVTLKPGAHVSVRVEAGLAATFVADRDDHVLRDKLATASGLGFGGYADLAVAYSWSSSESRVRPFLALSADGLILKANTKQTQKYYSDLEGYPAGTTWTGIDHQLSTRQLAVTLSGGIEY
jgi:hypothetical protein